MKELKPIDYGILAELSRKPRASDREIAKILRVSQPTVSRRRNQLEKKGLLEYATILDVRKLGFEILAITFGKRDPRQTEPKEAELSKDFLSRHPEMILISTGSGLNYDRSILSLHQSYSDFSKFITELKQEPGRFIADPQSFIIGLQSDTILREFTLKHLAQALQPEKKP